MTSDARQKHGNLRYAVTYNVIWANQKTESFEYHWLSTLAMFDRTGFPAILSGIGRHFKFCRYINCKWTLHEPACNVTWLVLLLPVCALVAIITCHRLVRLVYDLTNCFPVYSLRSQIYLLQKFYRLTSIVICHNKRKNRDKHYFI